MKSPSQQGSSVCYDVLILGSGLAGLIYALELSKLSPKLKIAILSKGIASESNTLYAQGGIAASRDPDDIKAHIQDTLAAGAGLCFQEAVEFIIKNGSQSIATLESYAINFSKNAKNDYVLVQEGGHSNRRIFNCGDATGMIFSSSLLLEIHKHQNISILENHVAINLITHSNPHTIDERAEVLGAYVLDSTTDLVHTYTANCIVLATGGSGKTYRYTSNPMVATGDGVAMAYRAGARIGNMEFYQFHPTLLYHQDMNNFLISEAVRGEGAVLLHPKTHERFMHKYAKNHLELATRDVVARAIFSEIEQSGENSVYLDITHKSRDFLKQRFPQIFANLLKINIDMSQDMIPVVPAAHYQCGGILTNLKGQTDLPRLYAIGEVAFTGLHGANRLASNSLLEAVVMAKSAAEASKIDANTAWRKDYVIPNWHTTAEINVRRASQISAHWRSLRGEMTSYAGIVRTEDGLYDLSQLVNKRQKIIEEYYWRHNVTRDIIELRNIVLIAKLIINSALARRESRGTHFREDYPTQKSLAQESILSIGALKSVEV
jgi:L-aspartate oxidase